MIAKVHLRPGHVQPVWVGHPWVFAQAIQKIEGAPTVGELVTVVDPRGNIIGRGFYAPESALSVRILLRGDALETPVDRAFFVARLRAADALRAHIRRDSETTGYRLVHAEGDSLPGLIVDRFGDAFVVQFLSAGMHIRRSMILDALEEFFSPKTIWDRTPKSVEKNERVTPEPGHVRGKVDDELTFIERGIRYRIPIDLAQKTGFYFDQRNLRRRVEELSRDARVLDAYSYVGSFGLAAARGGAREVLSVDESALALQVAATVARENNLSDRMTFACEDARKTMQSAKASFDVVVCDPPRLSPTKKAQKDALTHYEKLAELACRATKPGGVLVYCSCSAAVNLDSLTRALALGALRANVQALVVERHFQGEDHPVVAAFPEGLYLKALVARVVPR